MKHLALSLLMLCACAKPPPSKQAVAEVAIRFTQASTDAVTRAISPIDTYDLNVACERGRMQVRSTVDGSMRRDVIDYAACSFEDTTLTGQLIVTTSAITRMGNTVTFVQELNGTVTYEGPTYAGNLSYNALTLTTSVEVIDGRVTFRSSVRGTVTVGGTTHTYNDETYVVVDTRAPTGGGSAVGGGSSGGTAASGGGAAGATRITGAGGVTDLAVSGETAFFTGEVSATQPGIFSATATSTAATLLCTGPADSKLAGVVVDGASVYALMTSSSGMTKLLRTSTTATGAACQELGTVDTKGFFFGGLASMAKVGDRLVYFGSDGSLKAWSVSGNSEAVIVPSGESFFEAIGSTGAIGVVAQASPGGAAPALKTFTSAGLGQTLGAFSKPEFTTLGARVLWAIDGASGGVTFKYRDAAPGSPESTGATAQLGVPGRLNLTFCETNDGSAAGFAIAKSSDAAAGFYALGADPNAPRKLVSQAFDAPVHCAVTATRLWVVEGDLGGSRNLLRFDR